MYEKLVVPLHQSVHVIVHILGRLLIDDDFHQPITVIPLVSSQDVFDRFSIRFPSSS
ncbi:MAG: hypothetical protein ACRCUY_12400 [Thermoguttaceae bacterium]